MAIQVERATKSRVCPSATVATESHFCSDGQSTALLQATYNYLNQSRVAWDWQGIGWAYLLLA